MKMALTNIQKRFIKDKVEGFGSQERIKQFYKRKSLVTEYAHNWAMKTFKKGIVK